MLFTALLLGLAGSLHCIGMCSPLVILASHSNSAVLTKRIIYNIGRIIPYGILGAIASTFGTLLQFPQIQIWMTFAFGAILIIAGFAGTLHSLSFPIATRLFGKFVSTIKVLFSKFLSKKTLFSNFTLGMLNGLIPCGLTYMAATYCFLLPGAIDGFLFMITFGFGTMPAMIGFPIFAVSIARLVKIHATKIMSIVAIVLGCSVIARTTLSNYSASEKASATISVCK